MSAISGSSTANPYAAFSPTSVSQTAKDFASIGNALKAGNLASAQSALAAFENDTQGSSQASNNNVSGSNSKANSAFQSLASALQSGNLSAAQTAFANLQKDIASGGVNGGRRSHHHGSRGAAAAEASALSASGNAAETSETTPTSSVSSSSSSTSSTHLDTTG